MTVGFKVQSHGHESHYNCLPLPVCTKPLYVLGEVNIGEVWGYTDTDTQTSMDRQKNIQQLFNAGKHKQKTNCSTNRQIKAFQCTDKHSNKRQTNF